MSVPDATTRTGKQGGSSGREDWRTYRCPVCGHVDEVEMPSGRTLAIRCSHCEAALRVTRDPGPAERVSVQVATGRAERPEES